MSGRRRRITLSVETMESRDLLSGLTPALNIRTSEFVLPKGTDALHRATTHDVRHVDARLGAVMSRHKCNIPSARLRATFTPT